MKKKTNNLDSLAKCAVCGNSFEANDILLLEEKDQKSTIHATCFKCKSTSMIFLSSTQSGLVSLGVATDLDKNEVKKIFGKEAISVDEVIDAHQFVSKNTDLLQLVRGN